MLTQTEIQARDEAIAAQRDRQRHVEYQIWQWIMRAYKATEWYHGETRPLSLKDIEELYGKLEVFCRGNTDVLAYEDVLRFFETNYKPEA